MKSIPVKTETQILNEMVYAAMTNIYSLSKDGKIVLSDFEHWYEPHKAFFVMAHYVANLYDRKLYVNVKWFDYLRLKKEFKGFAFKKARKKYGEGISVPHEIIHLVNAFGVDNNMFDKIWYEFYAPRKEENNEN